MRFVGRISETLWCIKGRRIHSKFCFLRFLLDSQDCQCYCEEQNLEVKQSSHWLGFLCFTSESRSPGEKRVKSGFYVSRPWTRCGYRLSLSFILKVVVLLEELRTGATGFDMVELNCTATGTVRFWLCLVRTTAALCVSVYFLVHLNIWGMLILILQGSDSSHGAKFQIL